MTVGYLFDLDKTLVTYEPDVPGIFSNACDAVGVEPTDEALSAIGPGYVETFKTFTDSPYLGAARAARDAGLDVDPETFAASYIDAELSATAVPTGIETLLKKLDLVGVVTNGYGPVQRRKLAETGLEAHIDALVCPDDVEAFKPDAAPFDEITAKVPADEYVMVGDSVVYDIEPAARRGYRTVFVDDGTADDVPDDLVDHRVSSPEALSTLSTPFG